jgi:plasmid maintenance system antidote protein VapI
MRNTRQETKNAIRVLDIPKIQLARMVGLEPSRISEYIRDKSLTADKTEKIENAVRQIAKVWTSLGIRTDLSDVEGFGKLLAHINHCQTEELVNETARFARQACRGLEAVATCSLTEQKDVL